MLRMTTPEPHTMVNSKVPAGCWIDQSDWSRWPLRDYACSPNEWPYNLEAPQGTREFAGIVGWFLDKHPRLYEADVGDYLKLVNECAPGKTVTASVDCDPETGRYQLRFTIYGCKQRSRLESRELALIWAREDQLPELKALHDHVWVIDDHRDFPGLARR